MFRKDLKFLLHMWHPSCYSIKNFDRRRDRNQDQGNIPSSRHQRDQKYQRGLKNLKITHKRAGNKKGYRMVLNGNIKGYQRTRYKKGLFFGINMSKNENPSMQNDILVVVKVTFLICRAIYSLLYGVRFLTALKTVMRPLDVLF